MADFTQLPFLGFLMDEPWGDLQCFLRFPHRSCFDCSHAPHPSRSLLLEQPTRRASLTLAVFGFSLLWVLWHPQPATHSLAASGSHLILAGVSFLLFFLGLNAVCWADPLLEGILHSSAPLLTTK